MTKILSNWTYQHVTQFLEQNGFDFYDEFEHSQSWVKGRINSEPDRFVEVQFTKEFYTPKALERMIRQSGIHKDEWIKWASS
jgi:hypothetical protein